MKQTLIPDLQTVKAGQQIKPELQNAMLSGLKTTGSIFREMLCICS
ncbi:hypothetical protein ACFPIB_15985 [Adhaeribacter terreus]|uniref:Uncharacterized protein n=1 Tax=Adhaeribacter terreus TaxID=529703 RepID=A0ABW0EFU6_9BACT